MLAQPITHLIYRPRESRFHCCNCGEGRASGPVEVVRTDFRVVVGLAVARVRAGRESSRPRRRRSAGPVHEIDYEEVKETCCWSELTEEDISRTGCLYTTARSSQARIPGIHDPCHRGYIRFVLLKQRVYFDCTVEPILQHQAIHFIQAMV